MRHMTLLDYFEVLFPALLIFVFVLLLAGLSYAEPITVSQTVNFTVDNNTVRVDSPSKTFQTTCGQQYDEQFVIEHSYEPVVKEYYNTTYKTVINITNTSTTLNCSGQLTATRQECNQAKATCLDLYNSNITYQMNITSTVFDDINKSNNALKKYIETELFPTKQQCDSLRIGLQKCYDEQDQMQQNYTTNITVLYAQMDKVQSNSKIAWVLAIGSLVGWGLMLIVAFGKSFKGFSGKLR